MGEQPPGGGDRQVFPEQTKPAPVPVTPGRSARDDRVDRGTVLDGRYRLDERVGDGGSATVYRATDTILRRQVAVKVFHPEPPHAALTERRSREMRLAAAASDPHLLAVYDAHLNVPDGSGDAGPCYLVTEFVDGPTLADVIPPRGLPPADVRRIGSGVAQALGALHGRGLVHRDVKPSNVLLTAAHEAKLADLGIARELGGQPVTQDGAVPGTAPYLSPEQAEGKSVGPASDVYSLGLVLLECLTGRREFPGAALESALGRLLRDPEVPPTLPDPWPALLAGMTARDPGRRPPARVVAAVLDASADDAADPATDPSPATPPPHGALPAGGVAAGGVAAGPLPTGPLPTGPLPADRSPITPAVAAPTGPGLTTAGSPDSTAPRAQRRPRRRRAWLLAAVVAGVLAIGTAVALTSLDPDGAGPPVPAPTATTPPNPTNPANPANPTIANAPATVTVTAAPPAATSPPLPAGTTAGPAADSGTDSVTGTPVVAGTTPAAATEPPAGGSGAGPADGGGPATAAGPAGPAGGNGPGPAGTGPGNGNGNGPGNGNGNGNGPGNGNGNGRGIGNGR